LVKRIKHADKLLHFSVCDVVLHWRGGGFDPPECHYHLYVYRDDVKFGEFVNGGVLEDALACDGGDEPECGDGCAVVCFLYYDSGGSGGKRGVGYYRYDVSKYTFY
jgi:hypothetical protein